MRRPTPTEAPSCISRRTAWHIKTDSARVLADSRSRRLQIFPHRNNFASTA
jgi:hypothetical protein